MRLYCNEKFYDDYKHVNRKSGVAVLAKNIKLAFNPKMQGRVTNNYNYSYGAHKYDNMKKVNRNDILWPHCHQELLLHLTQGVYL